MRKIYVLLLALASTTAFAQQSISFETEEGFTLGTIHGQNGWEVTEGIDGYITNQVISENFSKEGFFSFKNANEPDFGDQMFPIFGANKLFDTPINSTNFTISYDIMVTGKLGADFEFILYSINEWEEWSPIAGVGIENRGYIYVTKNENYGFDYATSEWQPNVWTNIKIEITEDNINYYVNDVLDKTIPKFSELEILGFNMLHNNYGNDAYYDNFVITTNNLSVNPFEKNIITVLPNPATSNITVVVPASFEVETVNIYTTTGQKIIATQQTQNIDISALTTGVYILKATNPSGETFTKKIIKN
jgi:hypothetical protein